MNKLVSMVSVLGISLAFGCGTDTGMAGDDGTGQEILPNLTIPDVPEHGLQVITPIVRGLAPGTDHEICTWSDKVVGSTPVDVKSTVGYQTEPGHHIVVYYTTEKQPPGTQRECTDTDMVTFRFLSGNGKEGEPSEAPGNLVYRVPAGAQIVVNHHYLNATDETMDGQSVVNLYYAPDGGTYTPSGSAAFVNSNLTVGQGVTTQSTHCVLNRDMKLWFLTPHMHAWGKHITVDITHNDVKTNMFDTVWDPSFAFHPPEKRMDPSAPMMLYSGDQFDVSCQWDNETGHDLAFGFEMCVSFGQFVDDANLGGAACDDGQWGPL